MKPVFPNAQDCELLAYAPESVRYSGLFPVIPGPFWSKPSRRSVRTLQQPPRRGRRLSRLFDVLSVLAAGLFLIH